MLLTIALLSHFGIKYYLSFLLQKMLKATYYLILYIVVINLVQINKNGSVNLKFIHLYSHMKLYF